jgi:hypothetical protein
MRTRIIALWCALGGCAHTASWSAADKAELLEMYRVDQGMQFDNVMNPMTRVTTSERTRRFGTRPRG